MTEPLGPVTTTSSNLTPLYFRGEGGVNTVTPRPLKQRMWLPAPPRLSQGTDTKSNAAATSGGNVAALQTTITEEATGQRTRVEQDPSAKIMFYLH